MIDWNKTGHVGRFLSELEPAGDDYETFFDERLVRRDKAWSDQAILSKECVLVVAEGGMGKSELASWIASRTEGCLLIRLGDDCLMRSEIEAKINAAKRKWQGEGKPLIVLDALDENVELLSFVQDLCGDPDIRLVVTSRLIPQTRTLIGNAVRMSVFRLARLTRGGVEAFARVAGVSPELFLKAVRKYDLEALCATPFGCQFLLNEFVRNPTCFSNMSLVEVWRRGIENLCEESQTVGKTHAMNRDFGVTKVLEGAEWIAVCLLSVNADFVWIGEKRDMPEKPVCVPLSDMETSDNSMALLRLACISGIMENVGDGRARFVHANVRDYLMAKGMLRYIPAESWDAFLDFPDGRVRTKRVGVAGWLAAMDKRYRESLLEREPELLLSNPEFLKTIGPLAVAQALLEDIRGFDCRRAGREKADDYWRESLFRLSGPDVETYIQRSLLRGAFDDRQVGMALFMLEKMEAQCLPELCVSLLESRKVSAQAKLHCAQLLPKLGLDRRKLLRLLRVLRKEETLRKDELGFVRAGLLSCLWPTLLSANELVRYLEVDSETGPKQYGYTEYLESTFAAQLPDCLQDGNVPILMDWALSAIVVDKSRAKRIAQFIFSLVWPMAGKDLDVTERFARLFKVVLESPLLSLEPFANPSRYWPRTQRHCLSEEDFQSNKQGRMSVLADLVRLFPEKASDVCRLGFTNTYRLFGADDLDLIIELCQRVPADGVEARALYYCLELFVATHQWETVKEPLGSLHERHPNVFPATDAWKARLDLLAANNAASVERYAAIKANQLKTAQERQQAFDVQVEGLLYVPSWNHDQFYQLVQGINSQDGESCFAFADLTKAPGWAKLTDLQRDVLLRGIYNYLTRYQSVLVDGRSPEKSVNAECALTTLASARRGLYDALSADVWEAVALDVLAANLPRDPKDVDSLIDDLLVKHSSAVQHALLKMDEKEMQSALSRLEDRLTEEQVAVAMKSIARYAPDCQGRICWQILHPKYKQVLCSFMVRAWRRHKLHRPQEDFVRLYGIAFLLDPCKRLKEYFTWGVKFKSFRRAIFAYVHLVADRKTFDEALFACDGMDLAKLYIELEEATTKTEFAKWTFIRGLLGAEDGVLACLRNGLRKDYIEGLEYLVKDEPGEVWRKYCLEESKTRFWEWSAHILELSELKTLQTDREGARYVLHSNRDFLHAVKQALVDYEQYLQKGSCAVADLWNSHDNLKGRRKLIVMRPKCEELCSDHLARYLSLRLRRVIVNREVQVRKRYHKRALLKGARTDIQVESVANGVRLKIIIEVKGNWNKDVAEGLQKQLVGNYLKNEPSSAGIYVVLWFANKDWDASDRRSVVATKVWQGLKAARFALRNEAKELSKSYVIDAVAIDCRC